MAWKWLEEALAKIKHHKLGFALQLCLQERITRIALAATLWQKKKKNTTHKNLWVQYVCVYYYFWMSPKVLENEE